MARGLIMVLWILSVGALLLFTMPGLADEVEPQIVSPDEEPAPLLYPVGGSADGSCQRCVLKEYEMPPGSSQFIWLFTCVSVEPSPSFNSSLYCQPVNGTDHDGCIQRDFCNWA